MAQKPTFKRIVVSKSGETRAEPVKPQAVKPSAPKPAAPKAPRTNAAGVSLSPRYGAGLTPDFLASDVGAAEHQALKDLYSAHTGGQDLSQDPDVPSALRNAGLLHVPTSSRGRAVARGVKDLSSRNKSSVYASAADALDAVDRFAGKNLGSVMKGVATGSPLVAGLSAAGLSPGEIAQGVLDTSLAAQPAGQLLGTEAGRKVLRKAADITGTSAALELEKKAVEKAAPIAYKVSGAEAEVEALKKAGEWFARPVEGARPSAGQTKLPTVGFKGASMPAITPAAQAERAPLGRPAPGAKETTLAAQIGALPNLQFTTDMTPEKRKKIEDAGGSVGDIPLWLSPFLSTTGAKYYSTPDKTIASFFADTAGLAPKASAGEKLTYDQLIARQQTPEKQAQMQAFLDTAKAHASAADIQSVQESSQMGPLEKWQRKLLWEQAKKNGWDISDPSKYADADLARRAFTRMTSRKTEIAFGLRRQTGQLASMPAGMVAVASTLVDAAKSGDLDKAVGVAEQFVEPYTYLAQDAEKRGISAAVDSFVQERPMDAILLASAAVGTSGRVAGAVARTVGGTGEALPQVLFRDFVYAPSAESGRVGQALGSLGRLAATDRRVGARVGTVTKKTLGGEYQASTPETLSLPIGVTNKNLWGNAFLWSKARLVERGLRSNSDTAQGLAARAVNSVQGRVLHGMATRRDAVATNVVNDIRDSAKGLSFWQRERLALELLRSPTTPDGTPFSIADIASFWRASADAAENARAKALFTGYADHYQKLADVPLDQAIIDNAREVARPLGKSSDMLMGSVLDALHGMESPESLTFVRVGNDGSRLKWGDIEVGDHINIGLRGEKVPARVTRVESLPNGDVAVTRENLWDLNDVATVQVPASKNVVKFASDLSQQRYVRDLVVMRDHIEATAAELKAGRTAEARAFAAERNAPISRLEKLDAKRTALHGELQKRLDSISEARRAGRAGDVRKFARQYAMKVYALRATIVEMRNEAKRAGLPEVEAQMQALLDSIVVERGDLAAANAVRVADRAMREQDGVVAAIRSGEMAPAVARRIDQPAAAALVGNAQRLEARAAELRRIEQDLLAQRDAAPSAAQAGAAARQLDAVRAEIDSLVQQAGGLRRSPSGLVGALGALEKRFEFVTGADVRSLMSGKGRYGEVVAAERPALLSVLGELRRKVEDGVQITKDDIAALVDVEARVARVERMVGKRKAYKSRDASIVEPVGFGRKGVAQSIDATISAERVTTGAIEDMRNRFWNEIDNVFRERYSDKRPGWVSVEYVHAGDLRGMAGNAVDEAKVSALRGQKYDNPIVLDYDPDTGYAYISEGNHRLAAVADDQWVPVQVMRGKVTPDVRINAKKITEPGVLVDSDRYVPSYLYPHEVGFSVREAPARVGKPSIPGQLVGAAFERGARLDKLQARVAAREVAPSVATIREVTRMRKVALRQAELNRREAARIVERGRPIVNDGNVEVVLDAASQQIAVELKQYKEKPERFKISQIREEAENEWIARAELTGEDAVLWVGTRQAMFGAAANSTRLRKPVDLSVDSWIPPSRTMKNSGEVYRSGQEDLRNLWQRILTDTGRLYGNAAWVQDMQRFVQAISIRVENIDAREAAALRNEFSFVDDTGKTIYLSESDRVVSDARNWVAITADRRKPTRTSVGMGTVDEGNVPDQTLADLFAQETTPAQIEKGGTYYLIPRHLHDYITKELASIAYRPTGAVAAVDKLTRQWRAFTLNIFPRTGMANLVGSMVLAALAGAGPRSFYLAYRHLHYGDVAAPAALRQGFGASLTTEMSFTGIRSKLPTASVRVPGFRREFSLDDPFAGLAYWMNTMRTFNGIAEDFGRLAVWYSKAYPAAQRAVGEGFVKTWTTGRQLSDKAQEYLDALASGRATDEQVRTLGAEFTEYSYQWLGDLHSGGKANTLLRIAVPFQQWYRHILRLTFVTMPIHYPLRRLFIQRLGELGNEYLAHHGVYPSWMQDVIPIAQAEHPDVNIDQDYVLAWHMGSLSPFGTPASFVSGDDQNLVDATAGMLNPLLRNGFEIGFSLLSGKASEFGGLGMKNVKDQAGNALDAYSGGAGVFYLNKVQGMLPLASIAITASGQAADGNLLLAPSAKFVRGAEGIIPNAQPQVAVGDVPGRDILQLAQDFSPENALALTARFAFGGSPTWTIGNGDINKSQFAAQADRYRSSFNTEMRNILKALAARGASIQVEPFVPQIVEPVPVVPSVPVEPVVPEGFRKITSGG
jgi:hypothetical protein